MRWIFRSGLDFLGGRVGLGHGRIGNKGPDWEGEFC